MGIHETIIDTQIILLKARKDEIKNQRQKDHQNIEIYHRLDIERNLLNAQIKALEKYKKERERELKKIYRRK